MSKGYATFNAGSSSIKFSVFVERGDELAPASVGEVENLDSTPRLLVKDEKGEALHEEQLCSYESYHDVLAQVIAWVEKHLAPATLIAVGHRVVHGGRFYDRPVRVSEEVLATLDTLTPLAPLHQPHNLAAIRAIAKLYPDLTQIACFDTAFHATNSPVSRMFALPRTMWEEGIMRYGFHGLSYEHIAQELPTHEPKAHGRVIAAHLGSGASMCAMVKGKSVASTMGFSTLEGLPMASRCGSLDPGVLLYLIQEKKMDFSNIEHMLYHESGLRGVSGISGDMRELLTSDEPDAREAVDMFVHRICRELGSLAAAAEGLDVLVFTGGIGEHAPEIRARVCDQSRWLGVKLDEAANAEGKLRISATDSRVAVWVLPANEERVIAAYAKELAMEA